MKHLCKKCLEASIIVAIFCVIGFTGSLETNYLTLKQATIYSAVAIIYIGVAIIVYISLGEEKDRGRF